MIAASGGGQPRAEGGAADGRPPDPPIIERFCAEPQRFDLVQAVRLLFAAAFEEAKTLGRPSPPAIGSRDGDALRRAAVRFHSSPTLGFPQGAITAIRRDPSAEAAGQETVRIAHVDLACFGMIGPAGTLPRHYSSLVVERYRRFRDTALREFLDIFVQRMTALLCRAWAKYRPAVQRVWDVESAFEVVVGPLSEADFGSRLPAGARHAALGDLLRLYAGPQFEIRVRPVLSAAAVPRCLLGGDEQGMALSGSRLGWTTWLGGGLPHDRGDTVFAVG